MHSSNPSFWRAMAPSFMAPDEGLFRASCFADVSLGNISRTEAPRGEVFTTRAEAEGGIDAQAAARGFDVWYLA
jgi:hypothetical protein